jgi:hypothetical protein
MKKPASSTRLFLTAIRGVNAIRKVGKAGGLEVTGAKFSCEKMSFLGQSGPSL